MKRKKKIFVIILIFVMMFHMASYHVSMAKIRISAKNVTLTVGGTVKLKMKGTKRKVKWSSKNKQIAVVSKGTVKGKKKGNTIIYAKVGKKVYKCKIIVKSGKKKNNDNASPPKDTLKPKLSETTPTPIVPKHQVTESPVATETAIPTKQPSDSKYFDYNENEQGDLVITHYKGSEKEVIVPSVIDEKKVAEIGSYAFKEKYMTSIEIPDTVKLIGNYAFMFCNNLTTIKMTDSVISIGDYAFQQCMKLVDIKLPNKLTSIKSGMFSGL